MEHLASCPVYKTWELGGWGKAGKRPSKNQEVNVEKWTEAIWRAFSGAVCYGSWSSGQWVERACW